MSVASLGIDENTSLFYEGSPVLYGHAIWPSPFISIASHVGSLSDWKKGVSFSNLLDAPMLFREDSFDPVARIRRGRLYIRAKQNPGSWRVQRHPAYTNMNHTAEPNHYVSADTRGYFQMQLMTFTSWQTSLGLSGTPHDPVLILGAAERSAVHSILDIERLVTGEELITIRTRPNLSGLPELMPALIPEQYVKIVVEQYEKAASAAFRDDAESVIDRCREAATAALNAERDAVGGGNETTAKDLAKLGSFFESGKRDVLGKAANILARLHSRSKSAEQIKSGYRAPTEADAEAAITLLGIIYRELRWVR